MKINKYFQYLGFIGFPAIIVGCFIPWTVITLNGSTAAFNYFSDTNGKLVLICAVIGFVMVILKKSKVVFFPLAIMLIILASDLSNNTNSLTAVYDTVTYGHGLYLTFIGIALSFFYALLFKEPKETKNEKALENVKIIKENNKKTLPQEKNYIYCPYCGIRSPATAKVCHVCRHSLR